MDELRYPIGEFAWTGELGANDLAQWVTEIETLPEALETACSVVPHDQLDKPYRPGGWSVRRIVHHVADAYMNSYVRIKLALTEDVPTIKPYEEQEWALLADYKLPLSNSIQLLRPLTERLSNLIRSLNESQLQMKFRHPVAGEQRVDESIGFTAWHGRHHMAQITTFIARMGWDEGMVERK